LGGMDIYRSKHSIAERYFKYPHKPPERVLIPRNKMTLASLLKIMIAMVS